MTMMRANVFQAKNTFQVMEVPRPKVGYGEALIRITLTTICPLSGRKGTDATFDDIQEGYRIFGDRLDGVLKVAVKP